MNMLRNMSFARKIGLLVAIALLAILYLQISAAFLLRDNLFEDRKYQIQSAVELASDVVDYFHRQEVSGAMTQADAKAAALQALRTMSYEKSQYYFVLDAAGVILAHGAKASMEGMDGLPIKDPNGVMINQELQRVVREDGGGFVEYVWNKGTSEVLAPKITYGKGYAPWQWSLASGIYVDDVDQIFMQDIYQILFSFILVLIILIAGAWLVAKTLTQPISALLTTITQVAENLDLKKRVEVYGKDEVGKIAESVNSMLSIFQKTMLSVASTVQQVSDASRELTASSKSTQDRIHKQSQDIEMVATAMNEMSSTVEEVSKNTESAAVNTREAHAEANNSYQTVLNAKTAIEELANGVQHASEVINGLEKDSENIGSILDVIREIAEQTNLLALNAAIEAARAGEQGRGFAVVADEVRTLAKRTQDSIAEIETMIKSLQGGSRKAVSVMEESRETASNSVDKVTQVADSLNLINDNVDLINQMSTQIATSAEEQAAVANEVNQSIVAISESADVTNDESRKVSVASQELSTISEELYGVIAKFKL